MRNIGTIHAPVQIRTDYAYKRHYSTDWSRDSSPNDKYQLEIKNRMLTQHKYNTVGKIQYVPSYPET